MKPCLIVFLVLVLFMVLFALRGHIRTAFVRWLIKRSDRRVEPLIEWVNKSSSMSFDEDGNILLHLETRYAAFFRRLASITRNCTGDEKKASALEAFAAAMELTEDENGMSAVLHDKIESFTACRDLMLPYFRKGYMPEYGVSREEYVAFVNELIRFNDLMGQWSEEDRRLLGYRYHRIVRHF